MRDFLWAIPLWNLDSPRRRDRQMCSRPDHGTRQKSSRPRTPRRLPLPLFPNPLSASFPFPEGPANLRAFSCEMPFFRIREHKKSNLIATQNLTILCLLVDFFLNPRFPSLSVKVVFVHLFTFDSLISSTV